MRNNVCIVAILKDEEPFLDEWIVYHRMLGFDHFYLYDDNPLYPLQHFLTPYKEFVTVINWAGMDKQFEGRCNQMKAYLHAVSHYAYRYDWVLFIDGDEFVVLRRHETVHDFLKEFYDCSAISLNWHVFGHNGYYDNPEGLVTCSLIRRMQLPGKNVKTFTRPSDISEISSPHFCRLKQGKRVDANKQPYQERWYPGKTDTAHINHYQCRSFKNWMARPKRGDAMADDINLPKEYHWRDTEEGCLRQFVTTVAKDKNEYVDEYMLKYEKYLQTEIKKYREC